MSALKLRWAHWEAKYAALTQRERAILAAAIVLGGGFLIFSFGIDPFLLKARSASRAEASARSEVVQQSALLAQLTAQNADPDAANRSKLAQAKKDLAAISDRLARFEAGMVPPAKMQAFLQGLLARDGAVAVISLKTLPVTLVGIPAAEKVDAAVKADPAVKNKPAADDGIYQHGIEIELAGSYNALLNYLAELERMPQQVMWNSISFTVKKHPLNGMVLRVYTLSLDRNWLAV
jgi:MSHA biogenesis protein MshJ